MIFDNKTVFKWNKSVENLPSQQIGGDMEWKVDSLIISALNGNIKLFPQLLEKTHNLGDILIIQIISIDHLPIPINAILNQILHIHGIDILVKETNIMTDVTLIKSILRVRISPNRHMVEK